jgi:hypothetical protein
VANDATFDEQGLGPRWRAWWHEAVFGALGPVARTRRDVLARILARTTLLKDRARVEDRWLVIDDDIRIHLGTGQARDRHGEAPQAIHPDADARERAAAVFLPFEGDGTLTTILAKAFQLAR